MLIVSVLLAAVIAGCSRANYADDNVALANRLLESGSTLEVIGRQDTTYCSSQSCRFGDDRVVTTYQVNVLAPIDDVVNAFNAAYPDFEVYHDQCTGTDCDGVDQISASRDSQLVYLIVYENGTGTLSSDVEVPTEPTDTAG